MADDQEDNWDMKVDNVKTEDSNQDRKKRKARIKEKLEQEEGKRDAAKDLAASKPKKMSLEGGASTERKSRARVAEEMRKADIPEFNDLLAGPIKRGIAFAVDAGIFAGIMFGANMFWEKIEFLSLEFLRANEVNQPLDPEIYKMLILGCLGILVYIVIMALPAVITHKGWGKSFLNLRVNSSDSDKTVSFMSMLFRELLAKPVSLATVVGPLLCLFNKEKRGLHDFISGTVVMDDSISEGPKKNKK